MEVVINSSGLTSFIEILVLVPLNVDFFLVKVPFFEVDLLILTGELRSVFYFLLKFLSY